MLERNFYPARRERELYLLEVDIEEAKRHFHGVGMLGVETKRHTSIRVDARPTGFGIWDAMRHV